MIQNSFRRVIVGGVSAVFLLSLSACNGNTSVSNFLQNVDLQVAQSGGQSVIQLSSVFNLGNVSLAALTVPVTDPTTKINYGSISFSQLGNGQSQIAINVNTSIISKGNVSTGGLLPNGNPIPTAVGATAGTMTAFDLNNGSRIYAGGDLKKTIFLGVGFAIPGLEVVMGSLGSPANVFFSEVFGQVTGVAGIYGGPIVNQNGVAIFAKYTVPGATPAATLAEGPQEEEEQIDVDLQQKIDEEANWDNFDRKTQRRLRRFFYGKERTINLE